MEQLWLGYDNLSIPYVEVTAVLLYQTALDRQIERSYGPVPPEVRAVVVTTDGSYWPSRWRADQLRRRLAAWRGTVAG